MRSLAEGPKEKVRRKRLCRRKLSRLEERETGGERHVCHFRLRR